jgi:hypothetical protein
MIGLLQAASAMTHVRIILDEDEGGHARFFTKTLALISRSPWRCGQSSSDERSQAPLATKLQT